MERIYGRSLLLFHRFFSKMHSAVYIGELLYDHI